MQHEIHKHRLEEGVGDWPTFLAMEDRLWGRSSRSVYIHYDRVTWSEEKGKFMVPLRYQGKSYPCPMSERTARLLGVDVQRARGVAVMLNPEWGGYSGLYEERKTYDRMMARLNGFVDGWYFLAERIFGAMGTRSVHRDPARHPDYCTLRNCLLDAANAFDYPGEVSYVLACTIAMRETVDRLSPADFADAASKGVSEYLGWGRKYVYG